MIQVPSPIRSAGVDQAHASSTAPWSGSVRDGSGTPPTSGNVGPGDPSGEFGALTIGEFGTCTIAGLPVTNFIDEDTLAAIEARTRKAGGEVVGLLGFGSAFASPAWAALEMAEAFIFDKRNGIHIVDLAKNLVRLNTALEFIHDVIVSGHHAFVGLYDAPFVVVDVETTGGSPSRGHRITEVAAVVVEEGAIVADFQTLVNPGREIPPRISALTGITNEMVAAAPFFEDVAEDLFEWLEERVFVAHNVSFDWRFVSAQLGDAIGFVPRTPRLCTVQLARRLAPELPRRNLDSVAKHFGVPIHSRHRAYGDAMATARIFLRLLDEARALGIRDLSALQLLLHRKGRS